MHLSKEQLRRIWLEDRRKERRRLGIALAATAAVFAFCLCFRYNAYYYEDKFVPVEYAKSLLLALKLLLARLTGSPFAAQREAAIASVGSILYYGVGAAADHPDLPGGGGGAGNSRDSFSDGLPQSHGLPQPFGGLRRGEPGQCPGGDALFRCGL